MKVAPYAVGLVFASVCAEEDVGKAQVESTTNRLYPTGVGPWRISDESSFESGEPNPHPCEDNPQRLHWLLAC